jgi:hypothetical protein
MSCQSGGGPGIRVLVIRSGCPGRIRFEQFTPSSEVSIKFVYGYFQISRILAQIGKILDYRPFDMFGIDALNRANGIIEIGVRPLLQGLTLWTVVGASTLGLILLNWIHG